MKNVMLGPVELGGAPRIAAVVDRIMPMPAIAALAGRGADLLEMRVDLMGPDINAALAFVKDARKVAGVPLLGTLRETEANRPSRTGTFRKLVPLVDAVDIEADTPVRDELVRIATGKTIIISEHDFVRTPDLKRLNEIAETAHAAGAHIVKIAAMARSREDVTRLLAFCRECAYPMVAISMGELGAVSRVVAPLFGSLFSYAFVNDSVAPGQLSVEDLAAEFRRYFPSLKV
jgi:3-dehydroquinate dehydratase I